MLHVFEFESFLYPQVLWGLGILLPLIVWYIYSNRTRSTQVYVSSLSNVSQIPQSWYVYSIHAPFVIRMVVLACIITALARPVSYDTFADSTTYGVDIVLAMDISSSMLAQDLKPDRLEASKDVAAKFISNRPYDRIGLVVFSGESFTQCPLTSDHATLLNQLDELQSGIIEDGTAIGTGLGLSVTRLKDSKAISKVVVLLTDGVNNSGDIDPLTAAELAQKYGIRIYTIGVGTQGEAPYPVQTMWGIQFQMMPVEIDEVVLKKIAKTTGGTYFRATNKKELLEIYQTIDSLEKTKIEDYKFTTKHEMYVGFVLWALLLVVCEFVIKLFVTKKYL